MAGIAFLRRLLLKQAMKKSKDSSGILSLNKNLVNDVERQVSKWVESAKRQGQDIDKMGEQEIKYIVELNKPKVKQKTLQEFIEQIGLNDPKKNKFLQKEGEVVDLTGKKIDTSKPVLGGKNVDLSKYDDAALNALAEEGNRIKVQLEKLGESGTNYGEFKKLSARKKEIDDILSAAQDVPVSGYDNFKADLSLQKQTTKVDVVTDTVTKIKTMEPVAAMKEANSVIGRKGIYKNLTKEQSQKILKDTDDWIFQRDPDDLYDYNKKRPFRDDPDTEDFAHGGRTGSGLNYLLGEDDQNSRVPYGLGGMSRRLFLKLMGGAAAGTAAAGTGLLGLLKGGAKKQVIKDLTSVPIKAGADGMPAWFKPLVNKVIKEGDDVTKKFADADRQIVHKTKLPDSQTDVIVTQDITTGNVSVDIGIGKHGFADGHLGQPVRLEYKASEVIEPSFTKNKETIGKAGKTKEEFWVDEAEFTGGHPENVKFEESVSEKFGSHGSNFDEVEMFATGTVKKIKKASGGRVPLAEGNTPSDTQLEQYYRELEEEKKRRRIQKQLYEQRFGGPGPVLEAAQGGIAGMLGE